MQTRSVPAPIAPSADLAPVTRNARRHELDWLRVVVVLGLIPYHVAVVFTLGPGDYIKNGGRSIAFDAAATLVAFVGMPLLFVIAGAATWYALGHRRPFAYLMERLRRLAVPLIFGILMLVPVQLYFDRLNSPGYALSYPQFYLQFLADWLHIFQLGVFGRGFQYWGHLWFLLYLLAVSTFLLPPLSWLRRSRGLRNSASIARVAASPLGLLLLGVPLSIVEVALQGPIGPRPLVDYNSLYSGAAGLVLYAVSFVLGFMLVPDATFQRAVVRYRAQMLSLGLLLLAVHEIVLAAFGVTASSDLASLSAVRLLRGMITWCLVASALGFASRYLTVGSRLLQSLNEACFPLYVLHMPILTALAYYVVRWDTSMPVKFVLLVTSTAAVTVALYVGVVRRIPVMRFLFGLKPATSQERNVVGSTPVHAT